MVLVEKFVSVFECPFQIYSDQGKEFVGEVFGGMVEQLGIEHTFSRAYNPQANLVEPNLYKPGDKVRYLTPRKVKGKPLKLTNS